MNATEIQIYARKMFESEGPKAIADAARRATQFDTSGDREGARVWRRIEAALLSMRGPRQT